MQNNHYWERRQAQNMYRYMQSAEDTSDQIAQLYLKASRYLSAQADSVFEKYKVKHGLTEKEARKLIANLQNHASLKEMLQELRNGNSDKTKQELLSILESPAYQARIDRFRQLQNSLDIVMQTVYKQEKVISTNFYTDLAKEAYYRSIFQMQQRSGCGFSFAHVSPKTVDRVLQSKWYGSNYSERIWDNTKSLAKNLKEELLINLVTGRSNREVSQIIQNKYAKGASAARRLVRTESNFISGILNFEAYKEAGVEEYMFLATLDLKTSEVCRSLDRKKFKVNDRKVGVNCNPMHPWCRSTTIEIINEKLMENWERSAIDPKTGKRILVPMSMSYGEWYNKYVKNSPEAQLNEKKIQNRSADRKQYRSYKKVLQGSSTKALDDFQDMKYNDYSTWEYKKLEYQRRNRLIEHPELKLPNVENAMIPNEKFTRYLFGGENTDGLAKGKAFLSRLGYGADNWKELQSAIRQGATVYPATAKGETTYGTRYEQKMVLYGNKGTPANVVVGWIHRLDGTMSMASAYIKEVK